MHSLRRKQDSVVVAVEEWLRRPTALSLRIMFVAEALTRYSLLLRAVIPGKGRMSRVQTSESMASRRARSPRGGARMGMRLLVGVARRDMERLIELEVEELWEEEGEEGVASRTTEVFLIITWHKGVLGPTVVARCTDILLAMVPGRL